MHVSRMGDLQDVRVWHEAKWAWARYLSTRPNGKVYVELTGRATYKHRVCVAPDRVEWVYTTPDKGTGIKPNSAKE